MSKDKGKIDSLYEKSLDLWFIHIEKAITTCSNVYDKESAIQAVKSIFDHYYRISGYLSKNPIYRDARYLVFKIGEILLNEGLITDNTEAELQRVLYGGIPWLYKGLKFQPYKIWSIEGGRSPLKTLRAFVESNLEKVISSSSISKIYGLITDFESKIKNLEDIPRILTNEDLQTDDDAIQIEVEEYVNLAENIQSQRERLILDLYIKMAQHCSDILKIISINGLSRLLFGESTFIHQNFWHDKNVDPSTSKQIRTIDRRPELYILNRIKLMSLLWNADNFRKEGMVISQKLIKELRYEIGRTLDEFIFSNPYNQDYVDENPRRGFKLLGKDFLKPENDVITWIWLIYATNEDNPSLTFEDISKKKILTRFLTSYLSKGDRNIPKFALKKFSQEFVSFYREALDGEHENKKIKINQHEKLKIYEQGFKEIFNYMKIRKINYLTKLVRLFKGSSPLYHSLFSSKLIRSYHNVLLFTRQLGFDPLTFTPLKGGIGGIFELKQRKDGTLYSEYVRHHLDNNRKKSILLQDLLLTSNKIHAKYDKLIDKYGVEYSYKLIDAFNELVSYDGLIDEDFIVKIFNKHKIIDVYNQFYKNNKDLKKNIEKFNMRKNDMQTLGIDGFIEEMQGEYPLLYNRFYVNDFKNDNSKIIMLLVSDNSPNNLFSTINGNTYYHRSRKFSDLFILDYFFSVHHDLVDYYSLKPHIFKYWFGD